MLAVACCLASEMVADHVAVLASFDSADDDLEVHFDLGNFLDALVDDSNRCVDHAVAFHLVDLETEMK